MSRNSETLVIAASLAEAYVDNGSLPIDDMTPSQDLFERVDAVNGRATQFTTRASRLIDVVLDVEDELRSAGLSKRDRIGTVVRHRGAGPAASSYRNKARVTEVVMQRRSTGWVLVSICEDHVFPKAKQVREITLSSAQAEAVAKVALRPFKVASPAPEQVAA